MNTYYIIDFDSTFIQAETLDVLAEVALQKNSAKKEILMQIAEITRLGMEGKIGFDESLKKRLALFSVTKNDVRQTTSLLQKKISPSMKRNKLFFQKEKNNIYIVSGGFREIVEPIVAFSGISKEHIFANDFIYDKRGNVIGIDEKNELSQLGGKVKVIEKLNLEGILYVLGDGYTDWEIAQSTKKNPKSSVKFVAYTETVFREKVTAAADYVVPNFDEFLYIHDLPRKFSYPKNRIGVLLVENIHNTAITAFEKEGYAVEYFEKALSKNELISKIANVHILGIRSRTNVSKEILSNAKNLLSVGAFCIGTDQVDLIESTKKGIAVFNAPFSNTRSVVELVLGEIIMLARGTFAKSIKMHEGTWDKSAMGAFEVRGKTLGIIGYGNIGSQLSVLAEALGMKVIYFDTVEKLALGNAVRCGSLKELLQHADIVTVHVSGDKKNRNLIGEKEFNLMKERVLFLNLSRGFVVDMPSLIKYINNGKIAGCAIDVFPYEPEGKGEPFESELRGLDNVILTPHVGGSTKEAQENIGSFVSSKLIEYMNNGSTYLSVTLPQMQLPILSNAHRILHIHNNVPGVLAMINNVLAQNHLNIVGQYLKTNEQIGYVITDVNKKYDKSVLEKLRELPETLKLRVLY